MTVLSDAQLTDLIGQKIRIAKADHKFDGILRGVGKATFASPERTIRSWRLELDPMNEVEFAAHDWDVQVLQ